MKWIEDNLLGMVLLAASGVLVLLSLSIAVVWTRPVPVGVSSTQTPQISDGETRVVARVLGPLSDYQVINARPVFNESRLPVTIEEAEEEPVADLPPEATDPPAVKLTGIIIVPGKKIVSLTPLKPGEKSIQLLDGQSLTGEYLGWHLSEVGMRHVVLKSLSGRRVGLRLDVHDGPIKQPPRPVVPASTTQAQAEEGAVDPKNQPIDRAEQIRQRIAERREELRREEEGEGEPANPRQNYEDAIRALMNRGNNTNDKNDG